MRGEDSPNLLAGSPGPCHSEDLRGTEELRGTPTFRNPLATRIPPAPTTIERMKRLLLLAIALLAAATASAELAFIENDYVTAMSRARAKNLPIFVEAWAPW